MKRQVVARVDCGVWNAYKSVCAREELRPNEGVEGFLSARDIREGLKLG